MNHCLSAFGASSHLHNPHRHPPWEDFELRECLSIPALLTSLAPTVYNTERTHFFYWTGPQTSYPLTIWHV